MAKKPKPKPKPQASQPLHKSEIPKTFGDLWPLYIAACEAARQKPSGVHSKDRIGDNHLLPLFSSYKLDDIGPLEFDQLKARLPEHNAKTVNNITSCFRAALTWAHSRGYRKKPAPPCGWIKAPLPRIEAYSAEEYDQLIATARGDSWDPLYLVLVLLGGDAGLRPGEVRGLDFCSIDYASKMLTVDRAEYRGKISTPKHSKTRTVPMTARLIQALQRLPHNQGRVCIHPDKDIPLTQQAHAWLLERLQWTAKVPKHGPHTLRHTFCTLLANRGAPVNVIQELAGHQDLATTMRYLHTNQKSKAEAVSLLDPNT